MVARDILPETLRQRGAYVDVVWAYQTVLPTSRSAEILERLRAGGIDCVTFTSSSTVTNFLSLFEGEQILPLLEKTATACIGPVTAQTAEKQGLTVRIMPSDYTIPGLANAIREYFEAL
jgi:uroporphyrinogen III methyltransferase / synthase